MKQVDPIEVAAWNVLNGVDIQLAAAGLDKDAVQALVDELRAKARQRGEQRGSVRARATQQVAQLAGRGNPPRRPR